MVLTLDEESSGKGIGAKGVLGNASVVSSIRLFGGPDAQIGIFLISFDFRMVI